MSIVQDLEALKKDVAALKDLGNLASRVAALETRVGVEGDKGTLEMRVDALETSVGNVPAPSDAATPATEIPQA